MAEQILALFTSTHRRRDTLDQHLARVAGYRPARYPSVDVFLPTAGEPIELLRNTFHHVAQIRWAGPLEIVVLDDSGRPAVRDLARGFGFAYLARRGNAFKKAGNLQYGLGRSMGEIVAILDADFAPRHDFLFELAPYLDDPRTGIVQSPQYFSTDASLNWLERCAGATQEIFYRFIQVSRDAVDAAICVGTSALYRRSALEHAGGFPRIGHSEDVYTGIQMAALGFQVRYVPVLVSRGASPQTMSSFVAQQYRWCEGSMSLVSDHGFHVTQRLTTPQRTCFWAGFMYYISTALNAVLAPLGLLIMLAFFPDRLASTNMLPLIGTTVLWLVVLPLISHGRWRPDVLRVQTLYGFAHLFCILDLARGRAAEWVATNAASGRRRSNSSRVILLAVLYLGLTQAGIAAGLVLAAIRLGPGHVWANVLFALLGAYVFVPIVAKGLRELKDERQVVEVTETVDLTTREPPVTIHADGVRR